MIKRISICLSEETIKMIEELKPKVGVWNRSAMLSFAISELHRKNFPAYAGAKDPVNMSPEQVGEIRARRKQAAEEYEKNKKIDEKKNICQVLLGGEVITEADGELYCVYANHTPREDFEQKFPIMSLYPGLIDNKFIPSREIVFKQRPELVEKYGTADEKLIINDKKNGKSKGKK